MNYIDLFAGAGGLSEGFIKADFNPITHVELDPAACYTLRTRVAYNYLKDNNNIKHYHDYLRGDISRTEFYKEIPSEVLNTVIEARIGENNKTIFDKIDDLSGTNEIDLIVGGPPCQAYSLVGRARSANGMKGDPRNYLYVQYSKFLEKYKPKMFVFENVLGLKSAGGGVHLKNMENLFLKKGYKMEVFPVDSSNFGVLQNRKRLIIIGYRWEDFQPNIPNLSAIRTNDTYTVSNVLNDLPTIMAGEGKDKYQKFTGKASEYLTNTHIRNGLPILTQHVARPHTEQDKEIYRIAVNKWNNEKLRLDYNDLPEKLKTHKNRGTFLDRFKVVAADLDAAQTVVAHIAKDGHYYIHPDINQNRSISVREAARLQSFPDNYYFEGVKEGSNRTASYKQIGNAVPPLMANLIANEVKKLL